MKTIVIKTQAELDALPESFGEFTEIQIMSDKSVSIIIRKAFDTATVKAYGNATVKAFENSTIKAYGNSTVKAFDTATVTAYGNATVKAYLSSYVLVLSSVVTVKQALDYSTVVFKGVPIKVDELSDTATTKEIPKDCNPSFEEWLRRGYVFADGILKEFKSKKTIGEIEVFEVYEDFKKSTSYVVKRGDLFSHGKTVEQAINDLRYKLSDRDPSEFNHWKNDLDQVVTLDEAIQAYRVITGACETGTKEFVESIQVPEVLTPRIILNITEGEYESNKFKEFLT